MAENKELTAHKEGAKKAGFATIIGKPNVGKSTLMNRLIGQKIAITSYKPQTTRTQVRTILTEDRGQIVFLDTPGIHQSRTKMGEYMVRAAESTIKEVDAVLWLVEPREKMSEEDKAILKLLAASKTPVLIVINKIDSVKKAQLLPVIALYKKSYDEAVAERNRENEAAGKSAQGTNLQGIIPVSARSGMGTDDLLESLFNLLPEGEPFYDEDMVNTPGVAAHVFTTLARGPVPVTMITTSTVDISLLVQEHNEDIALSLCRETYHVLPEEVDFN